MGVLNIKNLSFGSFIPCKVVYQTVFILLLIPCCLTEDVRAPPILPNVTFLLAWNAPTELCKEKLKKPLDMSLFSLIGSPRKSETGKNVTIFYTDRLGYYPYMNGSEKVVHGGLPQVMSLEDHLTKAEQDILHYMPTDKLGLAIIDWEEWRPTWIRNWNGKHIYKSKSIELVQQKNANLNVEEATKQAETEFAVAARNFMEKTLKLGIRLRPMHLWGFYLFPDCYNHEYYKNASYNGGCPSIEIQRNNDLDWLWKESLALYPSIYLKYILKSSHQAALFVRNRIQEAIRVSKVRDAKNPLPVFAYIRLVYTDQTMEFINAEDLVHKVGETVALGASGIVVWGTLALSQSEQSCQRLNGFLETTLNPYLINVTLAARLCSYALCQNQGVCKRKNWNSNDYLHLNGRNFVIKVKEDGKLAVNGKPTIEDLNYFSEKFHCGCYTNLSCQERLDAKEIPVEKICVKDVCINSECIFVVIASYMSIVLENSY
uniref:Hyaluronidase n=1 Tax=Castor canadensis TaxID=51338 RepID=A0A8C0W8U8_CASCN